MDHIARIPSPIGTLLIITSDTAVRAIHFGDTDPRPSNADDPLGAATRLSAYFEGDLGALDDVPVDTGGTPFQQRVWSALRRILPGTTTTYGRLAASLGSPTATRAVGLANGSNPIPIVIPCHRVIGANGTLTGYGGGLHRKRWLLEHEGVLLRLGRD